MKICKTCFEKFFPVRRGECVKCGSDAGWTEYFRQDLHTGGVLSIPCPDEVVYINDRGWIFLYGRNTGYSDVRDLFAKKMILVEGSKYLVQGIDHFAIDCVGICIHGFGLMVKNL